MTMFICMHSTPRLHQPVVLTLIKVNTVVEKWLLLAKWISGLRVVVFYINTKQFVASYCLICVQVSNEYPLAILIFTQLYPLVKKWF